MHCLVFTNYAFRNGPFLSDETFCHIVSSPALNNTTGTETRFRRLISSFIVNIRWMPTIYKCILRKPPLIVYRISLLRASLMSAHLKLCQTPMNIEFSVNYFVISRYQNCVIKRINIATSTGIVLFLLCSARKGY